MSKVANIYNVLFEMESKKRNLPYPIHKRLAIPDSGNLINFLLEKINFQNDINILDAGCGTGNTLFQLAALYRINGIGISLSEAEIKRAQSYLDKYSNGSRLSFEQKNFESRITGKYQKIIAIESLKHADSIKKALFNFNEVLDEEGEIIIADDFTDSEDKLIYKQKECWGAPSFTSISRYTDILSSLAEYQYTIYDVTRYVLQKPRLVLMVLTSFMALLLPLTFGKSRTKMSILYGGLILEYLYHQKKVSYVVLIAKKKRNEK